MVKLTSKEIMDKVTEIVTEQLCLESMLVRPNANFSTELGADSLDVVELVMAMEESFSIEIPDEVAGTISTIEEATKFIEKKLEKDGDRE
jgi:acyl carrier protein